MDIYDHIAANIQMRSFKNFICSIIVQQLKYNNSTYPGGILAKINTTKKWTQLQPKTSSITSFLTWEGSLAGEVLLD